MRLFLVVFAILAISLPQSARAVPDTVSVRVADVTTSSFSLVWMTDVQTEPEVEVYTDAAMASRLSEGLSITAMPDATPDISAAARAKGIMKIRVSGLGPAKTYYVRSVTRDPANSDSVGYSPLLEVKTASAVIPYATDPDGSLKGYVNDLSTARVYIRPSDQQGQPGLGDLVMLETPVSAYPLSAFVGAGSNMPEGVIDLNNLFGSNSASVWAKGGEKAQIRFYRGISLSTLLHYRRLASATGYLSAAEPAKGFFADVNLDGKVDDSDFEEFRKQYRTSPNDSAYNPDFKFVPTESGRVDAQDFTRFAREYGRADVPQ